MLHLLKRRLNKKLLYYHHGKNNFFRYLNKIIICYNVFSFQLASCLNCSFYVKQELCVLEMCAYVWIQILHGPYMKVCVKKKDECSLGQITLLQIMHWSYMKWKIQEPKIRKEGKKGCLRFLAHFPSS